VVQVSGHHGGHHGEHHGGHVPQHNRSGIDLWYKRRAQTMPAFLESESMMSNYNAACEFNV
jgi:hypothetical protein